MQFCKVFNAQGKCCVAALSCAIIVYLPARVCMTHSLAFFWCVHQLWFETVSLVQTIQAYIS